MFDFIFDLTAEIWRIAKVFLMSILAVTLPIPVLNWMHENIPLYRNAPKIVNGIITGIVFFYIMLIVGFGFMEIHGRDMLK